MNERVRLTEWVREKECESKGLVIEWSSDPVIKGSSDQVIKQLKDQMIK